LLLGKYLKGGFSSAKPNVTTFFCKLIKDDCLSEKILSFPPHLPHPVFGMSSLGNMAKAMCVTCSNAVLLSCACTAPVG